MGWKAEVIDYTMCLQMMYQDARKACYGFLRFTLDYAVSSQRRSFEASGHSKVFGDDEDKSVGGWKYVAQYD